MVKVLFVCHGNICRSVMAEMYFKSIVKDNGVADDYVIASAGTSDEEARFNSPIYPNAKQVLRDNFIEVGSHYARQMTRADYDKYDYIICMEERNVGGVMDIIREDRDGKVYKLLDFTERPGDIDDPWYHRDFDRTFEEISHGCDCLLDNLMKMN